MTSSASFTADLQERRTHIAVRCIHCGRCTRECAFLQRYGDPGTLAETTRSETPEQEPIPFSCSLCGLCRELCPRDLDMAGMFLAMRRHVVASGRGNFPGHRGLLNYERLGRSPLLAAAEIPQGCDTVYFPGCALPGTRPGITRSLIAHLRQNIPNLGVVLNCCGKPSHDLGRQQSFANHFAHLKATLSRRKIRRVIVNCPNCYTVFSQYAPELRVESVYPLLDDLPLPVTTRTTGAVIVHDPCVMRRETAVQEAVRDLLARLGEWADPVKHSRRLTRCCGEGGGVHGVSPRLAGTWARRHAREAHGERLVTYCVGCAQHLNKVTPTSHILDLLFAPHRALAGASKTARPPLTYWHRWRLKRTLRRLLHV